MLLVGEYDQAGNIIQELVWLNDIPVATIRTDQSGGSVGVFYIHTDHLNAPAKITRPSDNAIIWRWDHDPYGNGIPNQDPDGNGLSLVFNLRFPGQYFDAETGLLYNVNRDYDPATGRYIESDPIGLAGGQFSTYTYVNGNPISGIDPSGLFNPLTPAELEAQLAGDLAETAAQSRNPAAAVVILSAAAGAATYQACVNNDDKCKKLLADIWEAMNVVEGRLSDLYIDKLDLYNLARFKPSPSLPKGSGSWNGHIAQVIGWQNRLRYLIKQAIAAGCKVPKYAWDLAYAPIPNMPLRQ